MKPECILILQHIVVIFLVTCCWYFYVPILLFMYWKQDGATLMHYAVQTASSQTIKILLLYNVDINLQDNVWLSVILFSFSTSRSFVVWEHNWFTLFQDGWTPLHLAVQTQRTDLVRLLLIKGADKTLKNKVIVYWFPASIFQCERTMVLCIMLSEHRCLKWVIGTLISHYWYYR